LRCGNLATAIKPGANGPSSSLKPKRFAQLLLGVWRSAWFREEGIMSARKDKTEKRTAWLMELGRELRAEYEDFVRTNPLPPRLVALADQVEHAVQTSRRQRSASER